MQVAILCADTISNYFKIPDLDIYTIERPAELFDGPGPVIAHPPCAQWSRMHAFANFSKDDLDTAAFCVDMVKEYGGLLEQPAGSSLFKYFGLKVTYSVDQSWWGFPARKRTYLYSNGVRLEPMPLPGSLRKLKLSENMNARMRSRMTLDFCQYLVDSVRLSMGLPDFTKRPTKSEVK